MIYAMGWKYEGSGEGVIKGETERRQLERGIYKDDST